MTNDELPLGWAKTPIGQLIELNPKTDLQDADEVGFVPMSLIGTGFLETVRYETKLWKEVRKGYTHFQDGDVLLAKITPCFENGKGALVSGLPNGAGAGSTEYFVCRPKNNLLEAKYLHAFFKTPSFMTEAETQMSGSVGHKRVPKDQVTATELPLAPLAEQKRIADKLEVVLGRVDACRARLDRVPDLLKRFRQSVLAAATSGQLTEDWREENQTSESGEVLLSKVLSHRTDCLETLGRKGACPDASLPDAAALPIVPDGWAWIPLGHLGCNPFATVQTGPFGALLHTEEFTPRGVPVVAVGNLTGMGFTSDGLYFVSEQKAEELSRFDVQAGDVLFARSGATLGKVCVAPPHAKDWRMTGHILRARLNQGFLLPELCVYALRADPFVTKQVFGSVIGSTRPGYNTTLLESIALPVPPLPEQAEIVRRVEALFALADRIEARLTAARAQVERLTPATLSKAFRGDLVPQDPNDEPASKLLERLEAPAQLKSKRTKSK
jgi:type I restriction enzyme S subunit